MMIEIRHELNEDVDGIRRVNRAAFGQPMEADLVDALRRADVLTISLVALKDGEVVGHIAFSPVRIESDGLSVAAIGLGPMAVLPEEQNKGIGSILVESGLEECIRKGHSIVVVLGHPEYYSRFGFIPAKRHGIDCEYDVPDQAFMVMELGEGALSGVKGTAKYRTEFRGD